MTNSVIDVSAPGMVFVESSEFVKEAADIFSEGDLLSLQLWLAENPESGEMIPRSGGCRKLRWAAAGKGKRGGGLSSISIAFLNLKSSCFTLTPRAKKSISHRLKSKP